MQGLEAIQGYLRWWRDPRGSALAGVLLRAQEGPTGQERAALAFTEEKDRMPVSPVVEQNRALVELILGSDPDVIYRECELGRNRLRALLLFLDNVSKKERVITLLENLVIRLRDEEFPPEPDPLLTYLRYRTLASPEISVIKSIGDLTSAVLTGDAVLVVEGMPVGVRMATRGWEHRKPEEPMAEPVVRGPKEGFTETVGVNMALVRRRLQDERLRVERLVVGQRSRTTLLMVYMAGLTLPDLVDEVRRRIKRIKIDAVMESGYIEELIEDTPFTPFPLVRHTERPDVAAAGIMEGQVVLLVDGTPHALVLPTTFAGEMQSAEDYYQRWPMASFARFLRYVYLVIALLGPSTYIAITTFHHEMLPTNLLLSLMEAREGVPFPALVEALLMEVTFEALREAGVRLPKPVGQAISIVGALVIGEAAVKAGLVSPVMVIVVSITAISSFIIPVFSLSLAIRLLRFPMMLLAGTFGFYGIVVGLIAMSVHLASLRSFGVPYMSPTMPPTPGDLRDMMIRAPWWFMRKRPKYMPVLDRKSQGADNKPGPHQA